MNSNTSVPFDSNAACERCGHFGAFAFDGETLCADCYGTRGSCCAEFGGDDLSDRAATHAVTEKAAVKACRDQPA